MSLFQMTNKERIIVIKSLEENCMYNKDFEHLRAEYLSDPNSKVNLDNFKSYLRSIYSGYYYKMSIILYILRYLLIIAQFVIIILFVYPKHRCIDESFDGKDKVFRPYQDKKFKVVAIKRDNVLFLRIVNLLFDLFFFNF